MHAIRLSMSLALVVLLCGATLSADRIKLPARSTKDAFDDEASIARRRFVRERY